MRFSAAVLLSMIAAVSADIYITSPVATTVFSAGQNATITWQDDGKTPNLQALGPCKVSIYVGNAIQQTSLQLIVPSVDVSTTNAIVFVPDGSIGPPGNEYFIRVESLSLKDATNPQYPALGFSPKFTLNGATGSFTPAEQAQIDAASTAPLGGSTASTPAASTPAGSSPSSTPHSSSSTKSGASPSGTGVQQNAANGASGVSVGKFAAGALAGIVGLAML